MDVPLDVEPVRITAGEASDDLTHTHYILTKYRKRANTESG